MIIWKSIAIYSELTALNLWKLLQFSLIYLLSQCKYTQPDFTSHTKNKIMNVYFRNEWWNEVFLKHDFR